MKSFRQGVFETNSSSTHAMVVSNQIPLICPSHIHFHLDEFGWEHATLRTMEEKAAYLYTSAVCIYTEHKHIQKSLRESLLKFGVTCDFDTPTYMSYDNYTYVDNASVDHCGEDDHANFVDLMLEDADALACFLFNDESYVLTANDNGIYEDFNRDMNPEYEHITFYKGN